MRHRFLSRRQLREVLWRLRRQELRDALLRQFRRLWEACAESGDLDLHAGGREGPLAQASTLVALALRAAVEELQRRPPSAWGRVTP